METFGYGIAVVVGLLMLAAIWGTPKYMDSGSRRYSQRPGSKNIKRK